MRPWDPREPWKSKRACSRDEKKKPKDRQQRAGRNGGEGSAEREIELTQEMRRRLTLEWTDGRPDSATADRLTQLLTALKALSVRLPLSTLSTPCGLRCALLARPPGNSTANQPRVRGERIREYFASPFWFSHYGTAMSPFARLQQTGFGIGLRVRTPTFCSNGQYFRGGGGKREGEEKEAGQHGIDPGKRIHRMKKIP